MIIITIYIIRISFLFFIYGICIDIVSIENNIDMAEMELQQYIKLRPSPASTVFWSRYRYNLMCTYKSQVTEDEKEKEIERITQNASIDEPPTACCRSGCANCVFIVWAEALTTKMENAGPEITEKIMKMVDDPSMKAYLEMELRIRGMKK